MSNIERVHTKFRSKSWVSNSIDLVMFNFRALSKKWTVLLMIAVFFVIGLAVPIFFVPYYGGVPIFYLTYLVIPVFIILGWNGYNVRNSTLYMNINSSGLGKKTFYVGQIITVLIVGNILTLLFWPLVAIIGHFKLFNLTWATQLLGEDNWAIQPFANGTWILILYDAQLTIAVTFGVYFVSQSLISNHNTYYIIVITIVLLSIIFGGSINDYFLESPGGLTYSLIIETSIKPGVDYIKLDGNYYVLESSWDVVTNSMWEARQIEPYGNVFPLSIFLPTLLFPFYGVGQFASAAIGLQSTQHLMWNSNYVNVVTDLNDLTTITQTFADNISGDQSWYDWFTVNPTIGTSWRWFLVIIQPYFMIALLFVTGLLLSKFKRQSK